MLISSIPETFFTVWGNLFMRAGLQSGETVLIHGGSGGIGSAAIALVKAFGARVIATSGSDEKGDYCLSLGGRFSPQLSGRLCATCDGIHLKLWGG
ncbi:alcohol dehydrogenase, zinc-containing [Shewanella benthica KT99]|uniref:Alcohol dehydrogenase, zinc-containing n=1 Tax=Shewanella benthica KT99 TaxID=314608 RepID=A9DIT3_9GAMM|nr:alcohol dehydrogenase, zinc-containing [Shewanella benthica KT99]